MEKAFKYLLIVAVCAVALYVAYDFQTNRLTPGRLNAMAEATARVNEIHKDASSAQTATAKADAAASPTEAPVAATPAADQPADAASSPKTEKPSSTYQVKFETTKGDFVVEVNRLLSPLGADRFFELVKTGYFDEAKFFRVVPGFVVQFGLAADPNMTARWQNKRLVDEPVKASNKAGTITFAMGGPNSRTTQVFINLEDNVRLDSMGFAPFGQVISGMDVVRRLNSQYGESITQLQGAIVEQGNEFLDANFPGLDGIKKASIVEAPKPVVPAPAAPATPAEPAPAQTVQQ